MRRTLIAMLLGLLAGWNLRLNAAGVTMDFDDKGLHSLKLGDLELLESGEIQIDGAFQIAPNGETSTVDLHHFDRVDRNEHSIIRTFKWGEVSSVYTLRDKRLDVVIRITNSSDRAMSEIWMTLMRFRFPQRPVGFKWPMMQFNIDAPSIVRADYGSGVVDLCNEDLYRRLSIGFVPGNNEKDWPVYVDSGRRKSFPDFFPIAERPIYPHCTDEYRISLRLGDKDAQDTELAGDLIERYRNLYPLLLKWPDRRPIGMLVLSSSNKTVPSNPRGWFMDQELDVTTEEGRKKFAEKLNKYGDDSVRVLKQMNAQGAIVWDPEGQEFPHATSYLGDPRSLPPEVDPLLDAFFAKFKDAGIATGVCVRPQLPSRHPYSNDVRQLDVKDIYTNLNEKIQYVRKRWGCTLFYVDSDIEHNNRGRIVHDASIYKRLNAANPGILLIPEHAYVLHHAYAAPYKQLNQDHPSTPEDALHVYPDAFSVLFIPDSDVDKYHDELVKSVKRGDVLMFRGWWDDPFNEKVKSIYDAAKK